ncbi:MAG: cyclic pyranopterin monophosphate synthase MoaC, partial [Candidatus Hydrothermarchaeota archaeon]|nr:cyclic pyranopterin monophosphate synthase MoaC [Candidatus Hydrothermarchaeota archaeon]
MKLTHVDERGVRMVEISGKRDVRRVAKAKGNIKLRKETVDHIRAG